MQTHKNVVFLSSRVTVSGASRGASGSERNPHSYVTKHILLKITGRQRGGRRRKVDFEISLLRRNSRSFSPSFSQCLRPETYLEGLETFGPQMWTVQSHFPEGIGLIFFPSRLKKQTKRKPADSLECKCDFLSICSYTGTQEKEPESHYFGPSLRLIETRLYRYPRGDTVGTFNIKIRAVRCRGRRRGYNVSS